MENRSSFERVVGNISENEKEEILQATGEIFDDQKSEELEGKEKEKTLEEVQIISLANKSTNEVRQKYGLENFDIPSENIHIINKESWPKGEEHRDFYRSKLQGIAIKEPLTKVSFIQSVFHEMLHFKSYNALQITKSEKPELMEYRVGLSIVTRDGKNMYFRNLNEAVTEEITIRFSEKFFNNSLFTEELNQTKNIGEKHPNAIFESSRNPVFSNDTYYAEMKEGKVTAISFGYKKERRILNTLIDKILEENPKEFQDREEVFEVFAKGMMTGNILPVGRLVDKTFGNGTLRKIGELDKDIQKQEKFVSSL